MFRRLGITSVVAANALSQILARTDVASSGFLAAQHVTIKHSSAIGNHIGLVGFEPTASWSRTRRSTKLSHTPNCSVRSCAPRRPATLLRAFCHALQGGVGGAAVHAKFCRTT